MPKKKAKKIKQANMVRQITVQSRAYGVHTRAARGSLQPAAINDAFAAKAKDLAVINSLASAVHNLLKPAAGFFKESMFWQKMLSRMHAAPGTTPVALLLSLEGLELNSRYPLQRFGLLPQLIITATKRSMAIQLKNYSQLQFKGKIADYRYDACVLFFDAKGKPLNTVVMNSKWFATGEIAENVMLNCEMPGKSKLYALCLRLHRGRNNEPLNELGSQGMAIVQAGDLDGSDSL